MNLFLLLPRGLRLHALLALIAGVVIGTVTAKLGGPIQPPVAAIVGAVLLYPIGTAAYYFSRSHGRTLREHSAAVTAGRIGKEGRS